MVGMLKRMRRLHELLDIRLGPGAAVISNDVKRIHLRYARKWNDGHLGPRRFWRTVLPRLKYHNPAVSMTVEQTDDQQGPATLTIFFAPPTTSSTKPEPQATSTQSTSGHKSPSEHAAFDRTHVVDVKHKTDSAILEELLRVTQGRVVEATAEEQQQLAELEEQRKMSEYDRREVKKVVDAQKKEQEVLRQARAGLQAS